MPILARRQLLAYAGVGAAGAFLPLQAAMARTKATSGTVILYDPAIAGAQALAERHALSVGSARLVALKGDRLHFWSRHLRGHSGPVTGITSWSDFVLLRGAAAEQGLRLHNERQLASQTGGNSFLWTLART